MVIGTDRANPLYSLTFSYSGLSPGAPPGLRPGLRKGFEFLINFVIPGNMLATGEGVSEAGRDVMGYYKW